MFGGKKFLTDGTATTGVLIESESEKVAAGSGGTGRYRVRVRVTFDDGTSSEFETKLHASTSGIKFVGATVPVRFDPSDRSKIDVDEAELQRRRDVDRQQEHDAFAAVPEPPRSTDPAEQLQDLWEQKKAMDLRGSELRRSGAPREEVGQWVHENEALDARYRALKDQHPEWQPRPTS
jgi:hypothetical protein